MSFTRVDEADAIGLQSEVTVRALFREVNDRIRELAGRFGGDEAIRFVCECDDGECFAPIALTAEEYDVVRRLNPSAALQVHDHGNGA